MNTQLDLPNLIRRLEAVLRDLRIVAREQERASRDKGVLGTRGLTEWVIDALKADYLANPGRKMSINELLAGAEHCGYSIPTARTLSKRLTERAYRVGDIAWDEQVKGWYWKGRAR